MSFITEWLALLLCIQEFSGSILAWKVAIQTKVFMVSSVPPAYAQIVPERRP
jgi:hypothetical protein